VAPRSGLALKSGIDVGAGVIDEDYRGNVGVILFNHGDTDFAVKAGDRITAIHTPGQPVRFFHNGRMTASSEDSTFADPFFGIWLSPKTSEPSLRRALLRLPG
jgi:hypothetical protein